ncbi:hypothetical protein K439DRAFT_792916 [Ramaria rubella]|nr:hypothetical protein K439DRAFT_792916 [Ramaria rubella]
MRYASRRREYQTKFRLRFKDTVSTKLRTSSLHFSCAEEDILVTVLQVYYITTVWYVLICKYLPAHEATGEGPSYFAWSASFCSIFLSLTCPHLARPLRCLGVALVS